MSVAVGVQRMGRHGYQGSGCVVVAFCIEAIASRSVALADQRVALFELPTLVLGTLLRLLAESP